MLSEENSSLIAHKDKYKEELQTLKQKHKKLEEDFTKVCVLILDRAVLYIKLFSV